MTSPRENVANLFNHETNSNSIIFKLYLWKIECDVKGIS